MIEPPDGLLMRAAHEKPDTVGKSVRGVVDLGEAVTTLRCISSASPAATSSNKASVEPRLL